MKATNIFCFFIYFNILPFIILFSLTNTINTKSESEFNAIYRIDSKENDYSLKMEKNGLRFSNSKEGKEELFRIISIKDNLYYIVYKPSNQNFGVNDKGEIQL